jgi:undecaprenyl-diphosphatase
MDEYLSFLIYSSFRSPFLDFLSLVSSIFFSATLIISFLFVYWFIKNDRRSFFILASFTLNSLLVIVLKLIFVRPRPPYGVEEIFYSFPSAHASSAFFMAVLFSKYYPKYRVIAYIAAFFVAFSRVYNGSHYVYDVLFGSLIGFSFAKLCLRYKPSFDKLYNYVENKLKL